MRPTQRQKLYCYVDEAGQDPASSAFIVVAVVSAQEQEKLRQTLLKIEHEAGTGHRKWHKSRPGRRLGYLDMVLEKNVGRGEVFYGSYPKPLPYFFPFLEVLEHAIKVKAAKPYIAQVFVDGIDHKKAVELTNALRLCGISLELVRSRRDESEPLIRLADMWAGCIRSALIGGTEEQAFLKNAIRMKCLMPTKENAPSTGRFLSRLSSRCREANLCQAGRPSPRIWLHRKVLKR